VGTFSQIIFLLFIGYYLLAPKHFVDSSHFNCIVLTSLFVFSVTLIFSVHLTLESDTFRLLQYVLGDTCRCVKHAML